MSFSIEGQIAIIACLREQLEQEGGGCPLPRRTGKGREDLAWCSLLVFVCVEREGTYCSLSQCPLLLGTSLKTNSSHPRMQSPFLQLHKKRAGAFYSALPKGCRWDLLSPLHLELLISEWEIPAALPTLPPPGTDTGMGPVFLALLPGVLGPGKNGSPLLGGL